jgi:cell wall-associated NlpC family hydrolase
MLALPMKHPTSLASSLCATALLSLALFAPLAHAAPESAPDAVLQLLYDKGVVPAANAVQAGGKAIVQVRDKAGELVLSAMNFLGVPYRRGGQTDQGFDCSGFTRHIFENTVGLILPHRAEQQARDLNLQSVKRDELQPGDLVFFNTMRRAFSHVGIYMGEGKFIHAPRTGGQVRVESMQAPYWTQRFNGARRANDADGALLAPHANATNAANLATPDRPAQP